MKRGFFISGEASMPSSWEKLIFLGALKIEMSHQVKGKLNLRQPKFCFSLSLKCTSLITPVRLEREQTCYLQPS